MPPKLPPDRQFAGVSCAPRRRELGSAERQVWRPQRWRRQFALSVLRKSLPSGMRFHRRPLSSVNSMETVARISRSGGSVRTPSTLHSIGRAERAVEPDCSNGFAVSELVRVPLLLDESRSPERRLHRNVGLRRRRSNRDALGAAQVMHQ